MHKGEFIPHPHCTSASGDCFYQGKCLRACTAQQKKSHDQRIKSLEQRIVRLERALYAKPPATSAPTTKDTGGEG